MKKSPSLDINASRFKALVKWLFLIVLLAIVLIFNFKVFTTHNSIIYTDPKKEIDEISISDNQLAQHFTADEAVRAIEIVITEDDGLGPAQIKGQLAQTQTGTVLGESIQEAVFNENKAEIRFEFPETESFSLAEYTFQIESVDKSRKLYVSANANDYSEILYINGVPANYRFIFGVYYANTLLLGFFALFTLVLTVALLLLFFPKQIRLSEAQTFFIVALIAGIAMTFIVPSGQEPDGGDHILRSFDVAYGNLKPVFYRANDDTIQMPENFPIFNNEMIAPERNQGLARVQHMLATSFSPDLGQNDAFEYDAKYSTVTYIPQGIGLFLARLMAMNQYEMLSLARLFNLLFYIGLTSLAISIIPVHKNTLSFIALMPMSIFIASSLSADAMINGLSFLFIALILEMAMKPTQINLFKLILPFGMLYFIFMSKPAYIFLGLLVLLIPIKNYPRFIQKPIRFLIIIAAAGFAAVVAWGFYSGLLMLNEGLPAYESQMEFVLHNIWPSFKIFLHTLDKSSLQYITWLNYLGWINYSMGILIIAVPAALLLIGLFDPAKQLSLTALQKIIVTTVFGITIAGLFYGLYIFDMVNDVGAPLMLGVQGRYFIPALILPFLALQSPVKLVHPEFFTSKAAGTAGVFLAYSVFTLTRLIY